MKLKIELTLTTALANGQEAADTLQKVADDLPRSMSEGWINHERAIRDRNGNRLGSWTVTE